MRALIDDYPRLPYRAVVPWPMVYDTWMENTVLVETWLEQSVGPHYVRWVWSMWTLHQSSLCSVSFAREPDTSLFLLRFG